MPRRPTHNVLDMHSAWGAHNLHEARSMDDGERRKPNVAGAAFGGVPYDCVAVDFKTNYPVSAYAGRNTHGNVWTGHGE